MGPLAPGTPLRPTRTKAQPNRKANIEKIDAGAKGAVATLRNNTFPNPAGLVELISKQIGSVKLRSDHKLVFIRRWETPSERVQGLQTVLKELVGIAVATDQEV